MKIFVAGSTGRVATELLKKLSAKNYQVIAGARRPEAVVELPNVTTQKMDLHA
ncbi:oxidoreductase, partial [Enterococcus faecium]